jgi:hypothetical protein
MTIEDAEALIKMTPMELRKYVLLLDGVHRNACDARDDAIARAEAHDGQRTALADEHAKAITAKDAELRTLHADLEAANKSVASLRTELATMEAHPDVIAYREEQAEKARQAEIEAALAIFQKHGLLTPG